MSSENGAPKIGVYVCHCGTNIAGAVDVGRVVESASDLPHVVIARDHKYLCSDPGQTLMVQDIREEGLDRIIVASCSPLLHERTFRNAAERGGINPYLFQMVNIREQDAWVTQEGEAATAKAIDLVRAAIRRVALHAPLETKHVEIRPEVLVVGGGIAGIHAALTLADAGKKVTLVEHEPSIGGHMSMFDKTFPTLDCAACILTPKMTGVREHPNITLLTMSEVTRVDGFVGNYRVEVLRRPRYVDEEICVGCLECIDACVYREGRFPSEYDRGLAKRKPIHIPFPQAVPQVALIDPETCIHLKSGRCRMTCVEACGDRDAIRFDQGEEVLEIEVGAIVIATGFETFDAARTPYYGYGRYDDVYSAIEIERMLNASGPTGGAIVRKDGRTPAAVGIIHCVGSRDEETNRYCSRVCCMVSLKLAHLVREKTGAAVYNFYIDMRTPGKGFEEFYHRLLEEGGHFIRGRAAEVSDWAARPDEEGRLIIRAEDTLIGVVRRVPVDMVILATGLEPRADAQEVRRRFNITCSTEGFFLERHPKLAPVNTYTDGIYLAGCCQGPKDIPDTVAQAGAAAAEALALIDAGFIALEPNTAFVVEEACSGCKTCIPLCPYSAISRNDEKGVAEINEALCKGCGVCVAGCPSGSIRQNLFEDAEIYEEIRGLLATA